MSRKLALLSIAVLAVACSGPKGEPNVQAPEPQKSVGAPLFPKDGGEKVAIGDKAATQPGSPKAGDPKAAGPIPPGKGVEPAAALAALKWPDKAAAATLWKPATLSPAEVASKMDEMMGTFEGVGVTVMMLAKIAGGEARMRAEGQIRDQSTFQIQFPAMDGHLPTTAIARADGKVIGEFIKGKPVTPGEQPKAETAQGRGWELRPVGRPGSLAKDVPEGPFDLHRLVFAKFIDGRPSFARFVSAAQKAGYKVSVERRDRTTSGKEVTSYRLVADRKGASPAHMDIVVDGQLYLPVTINAEFGAGKDLTRLYWTAAWQNNLTFEPKTFQLPS